MLGMTCASFASHRGNWLRQASSCLILGVLAATAVAGEIKLICEDTSETAVLFRKSAPGIGVDIFSLDVSAKTVRQLEGELKEKAVLSVDVSEGEIRFVQEGHIAGPKLKELFRTAISRTSGKWVRHPHYQNSSGRRVAGDELEALARNLGLWGPFGIQQNAVGGTCRPDDRKF